MALELSKRCSLVQQSEIRNMTIECAKRGGINLAQGICDTPVPSQVITGACEAMAAGYNTYTRYDGLVELRNAIAKKQKVLAKMDVDPEGEIVVSNGATGVFHCVCLALLNPGDEVILFTPYYGYHVATLISAGAVPVCVPTQPDSWAFSTADLENAVTPKTKGIVVCTPANPSGKVFTKAELSLLSEFANKHDLLVFTDEIYEHFLYDGRKHRNPATFPDMAERTVTMSGLSKTYSITGWRIGYCICRKDFAQAIGYFNDLVYVCAPAPLQMGAAKGIEELDNSHYQYLSRSHEKKRDRICQALSSIGLPPLIPQGAYYVLADVSSVPGKDSKEKAMHILEKTQVACVPGKAFYPDDSGENLVRFCFAKDDPILEEACRKLEKTHGKWE